MTERDLRAALGTVIDPELRQPITELDMVSEVGYEAAGVAYATVKLTIVGCPAADRIKAASEAALLRVAGVREARVQLSVMTPDERGALLERLRGGRANRTHPFGEGSLCRILLVGSGKGGVGKSTVTALLAQALAATGKRVGVLDADIFGHSIPRLFGLEETPTRIDDMILPPIVDEVRVISIGMFLGSNEPIAWRGPMLHRAISQFLTDVYWGDLDYLLLDLPPGTGDIAISLGQELPTARMVVVTTAARAAAEVAERSGALALKTGQRLLGVIENLSFQRGPSGEELAPFGSGGGEAAAKVLSELAEYDVPLLARLPLDPRLSALADRGESILRVAPEAELSDTLVRLAGAIAAADWGFKNKKLGISPR